jgi:hypothetical protein
VPELIEVVEELHEQLFVSTQSEAQASPQFQVIGQRGAQIPAQPSRRLG